MSIICHEMINKQQEGRLKRWWYVKRTENRKQFVSYKLSRDVLKRSKLCIYWVTVEGFLSEVCMLCTYLLSYSTGVIIVNYLILQGYKPSTIL